MHYWMNEYIIPLLLNNKSSQHLGTWNIYFTSFMVSGIRSLWWDWLHCWPQILKQSTEATGSSLKMAASLASQGLRALWSVCVCVYMCLSATLSLSLNPSALASHPSENLNLFFSHPCSSGSLHSMTAGFQEDAHKIQVSLKVWVESVRLFVMWP